MHNISPFHPHSTVPLILAFVQVPISMHIAGHAVCEAFSLPSPGYAVTEASINVNIALWKGVVARLEGTFGRIKATEIVHLSARQTVNT